MIIVRVHGSFSQQLGQYALGRLYADRLHAKLKFDLGQATEPIYLDSFEEDVEIASSEEIAAAKRTAVVAENTLLFDPQIGEHIQDGVYVDGVWCDLAYSNAAIPGLRARVAHHRATDPKFSVWLKAIQSCESVVLDLREHTGLPGPGFWEDAIDKICERVPQPHFFVFVKTDEFPIHLKLSHLSCTRIIPSAHIGELEMLQLMVACAHHVVTYNSMACWAARLRSNVDGVVLAPQQAFDVHDPVLIARYGRIQQPCWPESWEILPIRLSKPRATYVNIDGGRMQDARLQVLVWNFYTELNVDGALFKTDAAVGHDLLKPWSDLFAYGQAHGIDFVSYDQVSSFEEIDAVIFMDRPRNGNPVVERLLAANIEKYLLIYECEVIKPDNWDVAYHRQFKRIFTWNDALVDGERYIKINFAIDPAPLYDFGLLKSAFTQRKLVTMIAGAKQSHHPNELYSHRVRIIRWFELNAADSFDLYGMGWSHEGFPSYQGKVADKLATYSRYKFAICYENAKNYPGYITEKILDCFRAGVVPVYGGAPNINLWVPSDCYINIGRFATYDDLYQYLSSMDAEAHGAYLDNIARYLSSATAYPFSIECFINTITHYVVWDVMDRRQEVVSGQKTARRLLQQKNTLKLQVEDAGGNAAKKEAMLSTEVTSYAGSDMMSRAAGIGHPDLVIYIGYGYELPVYKRARALWQFYISHFPHIPTIFVRETPDMARGEVAADGYDLLVGIGNDFKSKGDGYAARGVWAPAENSRVIFRQMVVYDYLLRTRTKPFFLYQTTITSVVDFRALIRVLAHMPASGCYAGSTGRLTSPKELDGLTFVSGANSLFSRDVLDLMRRRYEPDHPHTTLPNDVWQALVLQDVPRIPLPSFNFVQPRAPSVNLPGVGSLAHRMLQAGHFHFRIKTTSAEAGFGAREDVDPWIMLKVMESVLSLESAPEVTMALMEKFARFIDGGMGNPLTAFADVSFYGGPRDFLLTDTEA